RVGSTLAVESGTTASSKDFIGYFEGSGRLGFLMRTATVSGLRALTFSGKSAQQGYPSCRRLKRERDKEHSRSFEVASGCSTSTAGVWDGTKSANGPTEEVDFRLLVRLPEQSGGYVPGARYGPRVCCLVRRQRIETWYGEVTVLDRSGGTLSA